MRCTNFIPKCCPAKPGNSAWPALLAAAGLLFTANAANAQGLDFFNPKRIIPNILHNVTPRVNIPGGRNGGGIVLIPGQGPSIVVTLPGNLPVAGNVYFNGPADPVHVSSYRRHSARGYRSASAPAAPTTLVKLDSEEVEASRIAAREDAARNVDKAIAGFIGALTDWDAELRSLSRGNTKLAVKAATNGELTEVTEDEIRHLVDNAYKARGLKIFEVDGEIWTKQRLQVMIINKAKESLWPFYNGVGAKGPGVEQLARVFNEAANQIYQFAMETNELLGVSSSFDRLSRTIYEATNESDSNQAQSAENLSKSEDVVEAFFNHALKVKASNAATTAAAADGQAVSPEATQSLLMDDLSFALRYRARRTTFDCINFIYPKLTEGKLPGPSLEADKTTGGATLASASGDASEAGKRTDAVAHTESASDKTDSISAAQADGSTVLAMGAAPVVVGRKPNALEKVLWQQLGERCLPKIEGLDLAGMKPLPVRAQVDGLTALFDGASITAN